MSPDEIRLLYNYNYWAAERMWECISQLSDEQFTTPIDFSSGAIRNHTVHLMSAMARWIERIQGIDASPHLTPTDYSTQAAVKTKWNALKAETLAYVTSLDQAKLDESVPWSLPQRNLSGSNRRWEVLVHLVNHSTDHRAQVLTLLHNLYHVKTVEQDLIFYLSEKDKPAS